MFTVRNIQGVPYKYITMTHSKTTISPKLLDVLLHFSQLFTMFVSFRNVDTHLIIASYKYSYFLTYMDLCSTLS